MTSRRRLLLALAIVAAPLAVAVPLVLSWRHRLPERVATHWSLGEAPDSFTDRDVFLTWWPVVSLALLAVGVSLILLLRRGRRPAVACTGGVSGFAAGLGLLIAVPSLDLADPSAARIGAEAAVLLPLMIGAAWLGWWAHGRPVRRIVSAVAPPEPDLPRLRPEEPAQFGELAVQWWLTGMLVAVLGGLGVVIWLAVSPWLGAELVLLGLPVAALTVGRVTASERVDVSLAAGPFTHRVPIAELTGARVVREIHPLGEFGGWGLRFNSGVVSLATRSGPGVEIGRTDDRRVVITTDRPERLAAVVNTLADRRFAAESRL